MKIRALARHELDELWSIDRRERIDAMYVQRGGELELRAEHHDVRGWPPGEPERDAAILLDCFEHGGRFFGAFEGDRLVGASVLESRFIGRARDQLQLKFLHVSRDARGTGLGRRLFELAVDEARERGARRLYISATPSENTIQFYRHLGCRVTREVDPDLFALEPRDIHLEYAIPAAGA